MARQIRIQGLAIVSADGMIADASGIQPEALKLEADQRFFFDVVDRSDVLVHGRNSGEGGPAAAPRRRIVLTRQIAGVSPDADNAKSVLWNPAGATFEQACEAVGLTQGTATIIGGTEVFGLFLDRGYDVFHLTIAGKAMLPGGRPVFPGIPAATAESLLTRRGLKPGIARLLDPSNALTLATWTPADS